MKSNYFIKGGLLLLDHRLTIKNYRIKQAHLDEYLQEALKIVKMSQRPPVS